MVDEHDASRIVSVFGGNRRRSRWLLAAETSVLNVFGRSYLDLREVETRSDEIEMTVFVVFGSVTVLVPEGSDVRLSGASILASSECLVERGSDSSHLPPIMVTATTILGRMRVVSVPLGLEVVTGRRRKRKAAAARPSPAAAQASATTLGDSWDRALAGEAGDPPVRAPNPAYEPWVSAGPALPAPALLEAPFDPAAFAAAAHG